MTIDENKSFKSNVSLERPINDGLQVTEFSEFFESPTFENSKPHIHAFFEIIWFREAGGKHSIDFRDHEIKENTIFFVSPGQIHKFDDVNRKNGITIKIATDLMKKEDNEELFVRYDVFSTYNKEPFCRIEESKVAVLQHIIDLILEEKNKSNEYGHTEAMRALVSLLLVNIRRCCNKPGLMELDELTPSHQLFVKFNQALEENFRTVHTVQGYADMLGVSTKAISNCVKECANRPPLGYINERVMLEAMRMLKYSNKMIKDIGEELGFDDPSYFVKFFKHQTGMLPFKFKRQNK